MKCIFHGDDLDGKCSAAIIAIIFPECEFIGMNYTSKFPWDKIEPGESVIMVDFCLQPVEQMLKLEKLADLTWIDHHEQAIKAVAEAGFNAPGYRRVGMAACELTWAYFHISPAPRAVTLLGRYDVFDFREPAVEPFQYGMRILDNEPCSAIWGSLLPEKTGRVPDNERLIERITKEGEVAVRYRDAEAADYMRLYSFETKFEGQRALCVNRGHSGKQLFGKAEGFDLLIGFVRDPSGTWTVSLYSSTVDVAEIADKYGGGGHKNAAGFQAEELPFKI